jgi:hypothetical protein
MLIGYAPNLIRRSSVLRFPVSPISIPCCLTGTVGTISALALLAYFNPIFLPFFKTSQLYKEAKCTESSRGIVFVAVSKILLEQEYQFKTKFLPIPKTIQLYEEVNCFKVSLIQSVFLALQQTLLEQY